jgi:phage baseplate assembly protein W
MEKTELNQRPILYKGIGRTFKKHPINNDIVVNVDELNVRDAILNLFFTRSYERPYSDVGIGIEQYLFEPMDRTTSILLQDMIETNLKRWEPRCNLIDVSVQPNYDENSYDVNLRFKIINNNNNVFSINLPLKRLR